MSWVVHYSVIIGVIAALVFELITIFFRFGLQLRSATHTRWMSRCTFGYRIHHGYPGICLLIIAAFFVPAGWWFSGCIIVGLMLFLSDFLHHALVLPITVHDHEFDLKYPKR